MDSYEVWADKLGSSTLSVLPYDYPRVSNASGRQVIQENCTVSCTVDHEDPYTFILSVWCSLQYRLTGDDQIVLYIKNNRVLQIMLDSNWSFRQLYASVQQELNKLLNLDNAISFDALAEYLQQKNGSDLVRNLFTIACTDKLMQLDFFQHHPLDFSLAYANDHLNLTYNKLLYSPSRITILGSQIINVIKYVQANPLACITTIPLTTELTTKILPDPTKNLGWCDFAGCIQDIFQDRAESHPLRTCVVETPSLNGKQRIFTYRDINRASNVVAHYLISVGMQRNDVVMIYSSRGVDLMCCVMGVLKAGATFSVIDPAYPPARQNIYLQVANPRGLIIIRNAGKLDDVVESFINSKLNILAKIPSVALLDDGTIQGNDLNGDSEDPLLPFQHLQDQRTGVIVGPDSNPTLSFTSGSEGLPKGVLGRHFSLAYYFKWMSQKFNLTENDRFTMLSGIAHDPIQRDMFTPLYLGAQLYIPTQDDIGTPGRLAQWMAKYSCTVTHLTPAMGQLLTAQADAHFPKLHHAFFVGDILTKRDCTKLQTLAENCNIVNMYGTTETQRAVSYFEVPSKNLNPNFLQNSKDVIPAGQGMFNVQLLIVNRHDRTQICGIGEVGEIYVRAGGLAEGYCGLPELNKEKFVDNWFVEKNHWSNLEENHGKEPWRQFWLGPRDRLYRTGDLGRYLLNGNCECCGRADDQVKIRGFRIELGEIDTNISQHPLVRENITLVRNNLNGEPSLISFIVPYYDKQEELLKLIDENVPLDISNPITNSLLKYNTFTKSIQQFLKKRLASYAIPQMIIVMDKLPLNPNGKVDKPKLQYPTAKQLAKVQDSATNTNQASNFSGLEKKIRDIWTQILPTKPVNLSPNDSFFDLGGHSILATRLVFSLNKVLAIDLPLSTVFKCPTIREMASEISKLQQGNVECPSLESNYSTDAENLLSKLAKRYQTREPFHVTTVSEQHVNILLTGATGFLGSHILADILNRNGSSYKFTVYAHVRANSEEAGMKRLEEAGQVYGIWKSSFKNMIKIVPGDLQKPQIGVTDRAWNDLANKVDIIIHNGALVHWMHPYGKLRKGNVISTISIMQLATLGKPKYFNFISSTSVLDSKKYYDLSSNGGQVSEDDLLEGSRHDLQGGYGQSKWVAEFLIRAAGQRGLCGSIIRPGYVTGDSVSGYCNTDDFVLRFLKSAVELGKIPRIDNCMNMVPVNHVARVTVAASLFPPQAPKLSVVNVTAHPRMTFKDYLYCLNDYGYNVDIVSYEEWKLTLKEAIFDKGRSSALLPLLSMVLSNLPLATRAPELDDTNAKKTLLKDSDVFTSQKSTPVGVTKQHIGIYIAFLIKIGFLPEPNNKTNLPTVNITEEALKLIALGAGTRTSSAA